MKKEEAESWSVSHDSTDRGNSQTNDGTGVHVNGLWWPSPCPADIPHALLPACKIFIEEKETRKKEGTQIFPPN